MPLQFLSQASTFQCRQFSNGKPSLQLSLKKDGNYFLQITTIFYYYFLNQTCIVLLIAYFSAHKECKEILLYILSSSACWSVAPSSWLSKIVWQISSRLSRSAAVIDLASVHVPPKTTCHFQQDDITMVELDGPTTSLDSHSFCRPHLVWSQSVIYTHWARHNTELDFYLFIFLNVSHSLSV